MAIDAENVAVILAALRYWQADLAADVQRASRSEINDIATNCGEYDLPDPNYIDTLCESLNLGDFDALPKCTLAIVCDGGLVQSICSDQPELFADVKIITIDYDHGGEPSHLVPQSDGTKERALVSEPQSVDKAEIELSKIEVVI